MSLKIIKPGLLDTLQDAGRFGYQHLGINTGGAMDSFSSRLANALVGKPLNGAVLELHFPAAEICFGHSVIISICGADFTPLINKVPVPLNHPILVDKDARLKFSGIASGVRTYIGFSGDLRVPKWLGSHSTHLKAGIDGLLGRALGAHDIIDITAYELPPADITGAGFRVLHWQAKESVSLQQRIQFLVGSEWNQLGSASREDFLSAVFQLSPVCDRMGLQLRGPTLQRDHRSEMLSSAVSFGTVQLLPSGQVIVLMADHQTTGGYPKLAHIISAHLPIFAQKKPGDIIQFEPATLAVAQEKISRQHRYLEEVREESRRRLLNSFPQMADNPD